MGGGSLRARKSDAETVQVALQREWSALEETASLTWCAPGARTLAASSLSPTTDTPLRDRMKTGHPIRIDRARAKDPSGGDWRELDPVAQGRVQILPAQSDPIAQAHGAMTELARLSGLAPGWDWSKCAVIAREWKYLEPRRVQARVPGRAEVRPLGSGGAGAGVRAGRVALRRDLVRLQLRSSGAFPALFIKPGFSRFVVQSDAGERSRAE